MRTLVPTSTQTFMMQISYKPIESDIPDNTIIEVVRKGYMLNDKILRPSLVILSKKIVKNKDTNYVEKE